MEAELRRQLRASKRREAQQSQKNLELQREVQRLSDALVALLPKKHAVSPYNEDDIDIDSEAEEYSDDLGLKESDYGGESSAESESKDSPLAVWDECDCVYRCADCKHEVVDSFCGPCGVKHHYEDRMHDAEPKAYMSIATDDAFLNDDRRTVPRGSTPLRNVKYTACPYGSQYDAWREDEYRELLARGATPLMCDTFHLEFKHSIGIVAWADGDLYDSFAGSRMQKGDFWKIRLGRRIELEADDLDGSQFIEALLEEIFYYPVETAYVYWETVEESPGIWVTRLTEAGAAEVVNGDAPDEMTLSDAGSCDGLEAEEPPNLSSVIRPNDYEPSEAGSESDLVEDQHPSWYIDHRGHDSTFDSEDDMDEDFEPGGDISVEGSIAEERIYDSADSDFDDDEILSGDEVVLDAYYRRA